jgi:hypothetical protein
MRSLYLTPNFGERSSGSTSLVRRLRNRATNPCSRHPPSTPKRHRATFGSLERVSSRLIVGTFGAIRIAIGVAFAVAPERLGGRSEDTHGDTLMTRSFAVREAVLGAGGLLAVSRADASWSAVRTWAGLGALTDAGDLAASLTAVRRGDASARLPALVAATGLVAELWALRTAATNGS